MDTGQSILLSILGTLFGTWLCLGIFVVGSRALHDLRRPQLGAAGAMPEPRRHGFLRLPGLRYSPASLLAADAAAPLTAAVVEAARDEVRENRSRLLRTATAHRGELGRWRRVAALRILARAGDPETLPLLERALSEGDADLAGAAVDIVGSIDGLPAAELLVRVLSEGTYSRSRVASQLDRRSAPISDLLLPLLDDASPNVRFWAATLLSRYGSGRGIGIALAAHAADADANVRAAVAESLGAARRSRARDCATHDLLADPVWYVRVHAARSAGSLGLAAEAPTLAELLADTQWWVRSAAKDGLMALGAAAYPALISTLEHPDRFARNGAAEVLQNAGYLDGLAADLLDAPASPRQKKVDLLRRIVDAGGPELRRSVLARSGTAERRDRLERLLAAESALSEAA